MSDQTIIAIISGFVAIVVALISKTDFISRKNTSIKKDIELFNLLPKQSKSLDQLLGLIDKKVVAYVKSTTEMKRNLSDAVGGIVFMGISGYLSWYFWDKGGWWYSGLIITIIVFLAGASMLKDGATKHFRDENGKLIKPENKK